MKTSDIAVSIATLLVVFGIGYVVFFAPVSDDLGYRQIEIPGSTLAASAYPTLAFADIDATIVQSGFVTIHETLGQAPGPIIGVSRYLEPGQYNDISIAVEPALTPGLTYTALLHVDDGDGVYEVKEDMPVTSNGVVVRGNFVVESTE